MYKAGTEDCRDELGLLNKEFVDEIQDWNMKVSGTKARRQDPWAGIFFTPAYDGFNVIAL